MGGFSSTIEHFHMKHGQGVTVEETILVSIDTIRIQHKKVPSTFRIKRVLVPPDIIGREIDPADGVRVDLVISDDQPAPRSSVVGREEVVGMWVLDPTYQVILKLDSKILRGPGHSTYNTDAIRSDSPDSQDRRAPQRSTYAGIEGLFHPVRYDDVPREE